MTQRKAWKVLFVVFAAALTSAAQTPRRDVVLDFTLPNGGTPQLRITDGETGTIELPRAGKFGFVPTLDADAHSIALEIFDLSKTPNRRIDRLELVVGGDTAQSHTKPPFSIRAERVVPQ